MLFETYLQAIYEELSSQAKQADDFHSTNSFFNQYLRSLRTIFQIDQSSYILHACYNTPLFCGHTGLEQDILFSSRSDVDAGLHMMAIRTINLDTLGGRSKDTRKRSGRKKKEESQKGLVDIVAPSGLVFGPDPAAPYTSCKLICIQHLIGVNKMYTEFARYTGLEAVTFCDSVVYSLERNVYLRSFLYEASSCAEARAGWKSLYKGRALELLHMGDKKTFCLRGCCITSVQTDRLAYIARELNCGSLLLGVIVIQGSEEYPCGMRVVNFMYGEEFRSIGFGGGSATYHTRISSEGSIGVSFKDSYIHIPPMGSVPGQNAVQVELLPSKFSYKLLGPNGAMMTFVITLRLPLEECTRVTASILTQAMILAIYGANLMHNTPENLAHSFPTLALRIHSSMSTIHPLTPETIAKALDDITVQVLGQSGRDGYAPFRLLGSADIVENIRRGQALGSSKLKSQGTQVPNVLSYQPLLFHPFEPESRNDDGEPDMEDDNEMNDDAPNEFKVEGIKGQNGIIREDKGRPEDKQKAQKGVVNTVLRAPKRDADSVTPNTMGLATTITQRTPSQPMMLLTQSSSVPAENTCEEEAGEEEKQKTPREASMVVVPNLLGCANEEEVLLVIGDKWTGPSLLDIPDNVLELIASYLPSKSAIALSHTCKRLHKLVWGSNIVCQFMVLKEFGWMPYFNRAEYRPVTKDVFRMSWNIGHNWRHSKYSCPLVSAQRNSHTSSVRSLLYIPEFGRLYSGASDTKVKVWTISTQQPESVLVNERTLGGPNAGALTLDWYKNHLFSGYSSGIVRVWDATIDGQISERECMEQETLPADGFLFFHPHIIIWKDEKACIWDEIARKTIYEFKGHTRKITSVKHFPADSKKDAPYLFMTSSCDRKTMIWDVRKPGPAATLNAHTAGVTCLETIGVRYFASGSNDKKIILWDNRDFHRPLATIDGRDKVMCLHAQNGILLSGSQDRLIRSWSLNSMNYIDQYPGHLGSITCIESDGRYMISASTYGDIKLWDFLSK